MISFYLSDDIDTENQVTKMGRECDAFIQILGNHERASHFMCLANLWCEILVESQRACPHITKS